MLHFKRHYFLLSVQEYICLIRDNEVWQSPRGSSALRRSQEVKRRKRLLFLIWLPQQDTYTPMLHGGFYISFLRIGELIHTGVRKWWRKIATPQFAMLLNTDAIEAIISLLGTFGPLCSHIPWERRRHVSIMKSPWLMRKKGGGKEEVGCGKGKERSGNTSCYCYKNLPFNSTRFVSINKLFNLYYYYFPRDE